MFLFALAFFATALLYASVGFGGGSTYNALLVLTGADFRVIPLIALSCNIIVVSGGVWHFARNRHLQLRRILPWVVFSIPASFLGGLVPVGEVYFIGVLGFALLLSGIRLLWPERRLQKDWAGHKAVPPVFGSLLGFVAGLTGIGGGIFLAPVLHLTGWGNAKQIAGACALFILVNSLAGMAGQALKMHDTDVLVLALPYWVLLPAVLAGGQIGSFLGAAQINVTIVKKMTGCLILYVAIRLLVRFFAMV